LRVGVEKKEIYVVTIPEPEPSPWDDILAAAWKVGVVDDEIILDTFGPVDGVVDGAYIARTPDERPPKKWWQFWRRA